MAGEDRKAREKVPAFGPREGELATITARAAYMMGEGPARNWSPEQVLAWEGFLEVGRRLRRAAMAQLNEGSLGQSMIGIMGRLALAEERTLRQTEIAKGMGLSLSRVSRVLDSLEQRGLVERRPCPKDGRATNVVLTDAGLEEVREAQQIAFEFVDRRFAAELSPEEATVLAAVFTRLLGVQPDVDDL